MAVVGSSDYVATSYVPLHNSNPSKISAILRASSVCLLNATIRHQKRVSHALSCGHPLFLLKSCQTYGWWSVRSIICGGSKIKGDYLLHLKSIPGTEPRMYVEVTLSSLQSLKQAKLRCGESYAKHFHSHTIWKHQSAIRTASKWSTTGLII